jgi:hypothetical protein
LGGDAWPRSGNHYVDTAIQKAGNFTPGKIKGLGVGSFVYAGLFLTDVPIELYEIHRHPSPVKVLVLILNIAVVVYLLYRIRHERSDLAG